MKNKVQLITYPDSLGGDLKTLYRLLRDVIPEAVAGGVHILPPFPSSGDRGFAPIDYQQIESTFGDWEDIHRISDLCDVCLDLMVNHISRRSRWFMDFLENGRNSPHADIFLTLDKIWPNGQIIPEQFDKIFLRRPQPYSRFTIRATGEEETVWTTFGKTDPSEQIDIDIHSDAAKEMLADNLRFFAKNNVRLIRLDALPYIIKKMGTSCFFVEPEVYEFLDWYAGIAASNDQLLLPEVHSHHSIQRRLAERGYWIYDFILPFLVLATLERQDNTALTHYLNDRPSRQITMLDCHDGIPVKPDLDGFVETAAARDIVDLCVKRGANLSRVFAKKYADPDGFDVHQIRITYYSALGCHDDAYLTARALQFFVPGIPQVYYVGLLAGANDETYTQHSNDGRELNRHNYTAEEVHDAVGRPVVKRLLKLIRFRNEHPAFDGEFEVTKSRTDEVRLRWQRDDAWCALKVDLRTKAARIEYTSEGGAVEDYAI